VARKDWQAALEELEQDYAREDRGLQLVEVAGLADHHPAGVARAPAGAAGAQVPDPALDPGLETLAVISYKQP